MGCGCVSSQITSPTNTKIQVDILGLINQYEQLIQSSKITMHKCLTFEECSQIKSYLASTNGQLHNVSYSDNDKDDHSNASGVSYKHLLTDIQRNLWKSMIIITGILENTHISVPVFREYILDSEQLTEMSFYQISLDVKRTFPSIAGLNYDDLTLLLKNFVTALPGIGYTQGMNFIAGFLLLCGFSCCQAYYILFELFVLPNFFLCHNFNDTFSQVNTCNKILAESIPNELHQHLDNNGVTEQMYSFSWFLCCFVYTLNPKASAMIWDYMIKTGVSGEKGGGFCAIINIAIGIVENLDKQLLEKQSLQQIFSIFRGDSLRDYFTPTKIQEIIRKVQIKKYHRVGVFITNQHLQKEDKQYRQVTTFKQGYNKYMTQIFNLKRQKQLQNVTEVKEEIIEVGNPLKGYEVRLQNDEV